MKEIWEKSLELTTQGVPFVVVTMAATRGSAPQDIGAKALITSDGLACGTIGGGKVEARAIEFSKNLLTQRIQEPGPVLVTWNLQRDIGMTCGGEVTYLFEIHDSKRWEIVVFGAGHVAQALVRVLDTLSCSVTCIDARQEWVDRIPNSSKIKKICAPEPAKLVKEFSTHTYFIVMTQGHATDVPILEEIFKSFPNPNYVGGIGSDVKAIKIRSELRSRGVSDLSLEQLRCPIGLPLGGNDPSEIAISIAAELLQRRKT